MSPGHEAVSGAVTAGVPGRALAGESPLEDPRLETPPPEDRSVPTQELADAVLETVGALVVVLDADGRILRFNQACCRTTGYSTEEALGRHVWDFLLAPEDVGPVRDVFRRLSAGDFPNTHTNPWLTKDGRRRLITWTNTALTDDDGRVTCVIATGIDDTGRVRAEDELRRREADLAAAARIAGLGHWTWDARGDEMAWSEEMYRIFATTPGAFTPSMEAALARVHPDDRRRVETALQDAMRTGEPYSAEHRILRFDGDERVVHGQGEVTRGPDGAPVGITGTILDITDVRRAEEAMRTRGQALEAAGDAAIGADAHGTITFANRAAESMFGARGETLVGRPVRDLVPSEDRASSGAGVARAGKDPADLLSGKTVETEAVGPDGSTFPVETSVARVDGAGETAFITTIRDITERKRVEQELRRLATTDGLTGLYNRRQFIVLLDQAVRLAARNRRQGALLFLDLDNLKYVNDTYGHLLGDELLRAISYALTRAVRASDVVARTGGDEFAVILHNAEPADAYEKAVHLCRVVSETRVDAEGESAGVTCSAGLVSFPLEKATAEDLMAFADLAMYRAKESGEGGVRVYDPASGERETMTALQHSRNVILSALDDDRFRLYWQPIVAVDSREQAMREILIRMEDEHGKLRLPGGFIPAAEALGLVRSIDELVVTRTFGLWRRWADDGVPLTLSINISARSVGSQVAAFIIQQAEEAGIDPSRIVIELTETAAVRQASQVAGFGRRLHEAGFKMAVDDFGAGETSIQRLRAFPFDYVKLDGSLVMNLAGDSRERALVHHLSGIAAALGAETIAEFVQDEPTMDFLAECGVRYAQGYYLGMPGPVEVPPADDP